MATQRMNLHAWLHQVHRGDFTPGPVNNAAIILQRIVSLLICLKKSQEIQGFLGKKAQLKPDAMPTIFPHKAVTAKTRQHTVMRIKQKEITCLILLINSFSIITITGITFKFC